MLGFVFLDTWNFKGKQMKSALIEKLQQAMDEHVANHSECGCQLVIYRDGEMVCDLAAGYLDGDRTVKVDHDTLFPVFSAGKSILTTLVHICVEKGFFKYEDPVSKYWREYACNGKQDTCIRHLLTHRGALWDFPADFEFRDRYNWEKSCAALEQSPLLGELDGFHEYHAYTYGVLLGRVLEKAVRKPLRSILKEFILDPLEITDFFWGNPGMRNANTARIVPIVSEDGTPMLNEWLEINKAEYLFDGLNPSVNTAATASALAKIHASLVGSGYRNIRLLSESHHSPKIKTIKRSRITLSSSGPQNN